MFGSKSSNKNLKISYLKINKVIFHIFKYAHTNKFRDKILIQIINVFDTIFINYRITKY